MTNEQPRPECIEKFKQLKDDIKERVMRPDCNNLFQNLDKSNSLLKQSMENIEKRFDKLEIILINIPKELEKNMEENFVKKLEFQPIKDKANKHDKIFFGIYTIIFGVIVTALVKLIVI